MWRVLVCCCAMQGVPQTAASAAHAVRLSLSNQLHGLNTHAQEVSSAQMRMCPCPRVSHVWDLCAPGADVLCDSCSEHWQHCCVLINQ